MRSHDNRDMNEMEKLYRAQIETLRNQLREANQTINGLRSDLECAERQLTKTISKEVA